MKCMCVCTYEFDQIEKVMAGHQRDHKWAAVSQVRNHCSMQLIIQYIQPDALDRKQKISHL
jgi:hypothetical protein